jgi:hypothetical protein
MDWSATGLVMIQYMLEDEDMVLKSVDWGEWRQLEKMTCVDVIAHFLTEYLKRELGFEFSAF